MKKLFFAVLICLLVLGGAGNAIAQDTKQTQQPSETVNNSSDELNRASFVSMLVKAAELEPGEADVKLPSDVQSDAWYTESIKIALQNDIIKGYNDNTFKPEQEITYLEASTLIVRTLGLPSNVPAPGTTELSLNKNHWGYNIFSWFVNEAFITGNQNPHAILTRKDGADLLNKVFGTREIAHKINKQVEEAQNDIYTISYDGTINLQMEFNQDLAAQDNMPSEIDLQAKMAGEIATNEGMHQVIETKIPIPGMSQDIHIEQYLTDEGIFMKMNNPETGEAIWSKMPSNMFPNISDLLKSKSNPIPPEIEKMFYYRYLGEENDTIKLAFYGKINDFNKFISMFADQGLPSGMEEMTKQIEGIIKSTAVKGTISIDKKTNLVVNTDMFASIIYNENFAGNSFPIKSMTAEYTINYKDYNQKISIVLPQEALDAKEIPMTSQPVEQNAD